MGLTFQLPKDRKKNKFILVINVIFFDLFFERKFGDFTVRISGSPSNWTIPEMEKRGEKSQTGSKGRGFPLSQWGRVSVRTALSHREEQGRGRKYETFAPPPPPPPGSTWGGGGGGFLAFWW